MNLIMIVKITAFALSMAAFVAGCMKFMKKGKAMYFQIITLSAGCYSLGLLFSIILALCTGTSPAGYNSGCLGITGCGLFLLSANYGQIDGIMDDRAGIFRKKRIAAAAAPLAILLLWAAAAAVSGIKCMLPAFLLMLPVLPASYFCLKVLIFPDMDFVFLRRIKPCNIWMLLICLSVTVQLTGAFCGNVIIEIVGMAAASVSVCLMTAAAMIGGRAWTV